MLPIGSEVWQIVKQMADLALVLDPQSGTLDLALEDDDVLGDDGIDTAVLISLLVEARAEDGEPVPGADDDRRGWWADQFSEIPGDRIGGRRWLLQRAAARQGVEAREKAYCEEALAWLLEDRVASEVDVTVERDGAQLGTRVRILRPSGDEISFRFAHVWDDY